MLKKHMLCNIICSRFFVALASENDSKIQLFFGTFSKTSILRKCSETLAVRTKIKVRSLQKRKKNHQKIDSQTHSKKASKKSFPEIDFGLHFDLRNPPKTFKIAPKSEAKRSLFRDAMQLARKSAEINGRRRL